MAFTPYAGAKVERIFELTKKKCKKVWKFRENSVSLHRQDECLGYAAECGE